MNKSPWSLVPQSIARADKTIVHRLVTKEKLQMDISSCGPRTTDCGLSNKAI